MDLSLGGHDRRFDFAQYCDQCITTRSTLERWLGTSQWHHTWGSQFGGHFCGDVYDAKLASGFAVVCWAVDFSLGQCGGHYRGGHCGPEPSKGSTSSTAGSAAEHGKSELGAIQRKKSHRLRVLIMVSPRHKAGNLWNWYFWQCKACSSFSWSRLAVSLGSRKCTSHGYNKAIFFIAHGFSMVCQVGFNFQPSLAACVFSPSPVHGHRIFKSNWLWWGRKGQPSVARSWLSTSTGLAPTTTWLLATTARVARPSQLFSMVGGWK